MASSEPWIPRSPRERIEGLAWLPRLMDKGRRYLAGGQALLGAYMYGDHDFLDARLLSFLGLDDQTVLRILAGEPDDVAAARQIVARSGRLREDCEQWTEQFLRLFAAAFFVLDIDEERLPPTPVTSAIRFGYNYVLIPPVLTVFRLLERRRVRPAPDAAPGGR